MTRGLTPVLSGRDSARLEAASAAFAGLEIRVAAVDEPKQLDRALDGVGAVINAAGPFSITASPVIEAAIRARLPYLDIAAEPDVVAATIDQHGSQALDAAIVLAPAIAFFGGLGDLLATATMGDWTQADAVSLAYYLSSWKPTLGTRITNDAAGTRRGGRRLVFEDGRLGLRHGAPPATEWTFPAPIGTRAVVAEFTTADSVTMSRHLKARVISEYMSGEALEGFSDPDRSPPVAVDARGRSAQQFLVEAVVRRGTQQRRGFVRGQDIYAITAPLVVEAVRRVLAEPSRWRGVVAAGELGVARGFLEALAPGHIQLEIG